MKRGFKVMAAALGVALLVGVIAVGAVFAADPPSGTTNYHDMFVGKLAKILGIDQKKLEDASLQARTETVDQMVKDGRITQDQAKFMQERMSQFGADGGPMGFKGGPMHGGRFGGDSSGPRGTPRWGAAPTPAPSQ